MRIIAHLDMDAFFASIEERDNPYLRGKPLVIGSDPKNGKGRGVVSTANYVAREYGIHSGMPISVAWRLSEEAKKQEKERCVFLQPDLMKYQKISKNLERILRKYVKKLEKASIDEFYLDLSFIKSYKKAENLCKKIKKEIKKKEKLTCSIGIGPNKLIAKIASQLKKPDGLTVIQPKQVAQILDPLSVRAIPGVGPKTEEILLGLNIKTIKDLKKLPKIQLIKLFGKFGQNLYKKVRGIDTTPIVEKREIKSIGTQETFLKDTLNPEFILEKFQKLIDKTFKDFKEKGFHSFRTITVIVRFFDFETRSFSRTFKEPLSSKKSLLIKGTNMLLPFLDKRKNPKRKLIRLIGIRIKNLR
jgi:DNA polymerase IV (DinB-like DNA polymerase)